MKLHLIVYAALIGLLTACEHEIPFTPKTTEPQLIMNALLDAGKPENEVFLHLNEGQSIGRLHEATLTLFVNGQIAETPRALTAEEICGSPDDYPEGSIPIYESIRYKLFRLTTAFRPGDHIRLEATAEGGKYHASAEVTMPQPVEGLHVDTCLAYLREYKRYTPYRQYKITLQDRPGEKNYYRLDIQNHYHIKAKYTIAILDEEGKPITDEYGIPFYEERDTTFKYTDYELINREDVILTDGHVTHSDDDDENALFPTIKNKYNIFPDNQFTNSHATLKVYTALNQEYLPGYSDVRSKLHFITVRLLSLTEDEYRYLKALNCLEDSDYDEALMEPICLPSNVTGGLGFVGACSECKVVLEVEEDKDSR